MRALLLLSGFLVPLAAAAQQPHGQEIQRAIIQLDERSAGITRPTPRPEVGLPLHPDPVIARELRPYERMREAERRETKAGTKPGSDPGFTKPGSDPVRPLPLPGGAQSGVDAVAIPRVGD